jgi:hypothetical protein
MKTDLEEEADVVVPEVEVLEDPPKELMNKRLKKFNKNDINSI